MFLHTFHAPGNLFQTSPAKVVEPRNKVLAMIFRQTFEMRTKLVVFRVFLGDEKPGFAEPPTFAESP